MNCSDHPAAAAAAPEFLARLGQYSQLCGKIAALLDEMENRAGAFNTADEAEDTVLER